MHPPTLRIFDISDPTVEHIIVLRHVVNIQRRGTEIKIYSTGNWLDAIETVNEIRTALSNYLALHP